MRVGNDMPPPSGVAIRASGPSAIQISGATSFSVLIGS